MGKVTQPTMRSCTYSTSIGFTCKQLTFMERFRESMFKNKSEYIRFLVDKDIKLTERFVKRKLEKD